jgi:hypothetical protein
MCYRIKTTLGKPKPAKRVVRLIDQLGNESTAVLKPFLQCNPAQRTDGTATPGLVNPSAHLVCYKIRTEKAAGNQSPMLPKKIEIGTKSCRGESGIRRHEVSLVCMPSNEVLPELTNRPTSGGYR